MGRVTGSSPCLSKGGKMKTREQILESLRLSESEEGRVGLVDLFLASKPEINEPKTKKKDKR